MAHAFRVWVDGICTWEFLVLSYCTVLIELIELARSRPKVSQVAPGSYDINYPFAEYNLQVCRLFKVNFALHPGRLDGSWVTVSSGTLVKTPTMQHTVLWLPPPAASTCCCWIHGALLARVVQRRLFTWQLESVFFSFTGFHLLLSCSGLYMLHVEVK